MTETPKVVEPVKQPTLDWKAAEEHIKKLEAYVMKPEFKDKPGLNPFLYVANVTHPLKEAMADEKKRSIELHKHIMALKEDAPDAKKYFKNPVK